MYQLLLRSSNKRSNAFENKYRLSVGRRKRPGKRGEDAQRDARGWLGGYLHAEVLCWVGSPITGLLQGADYYSEVTSVDSKLQELIDKR